jgi:hypothetical protein
MTVTTLTDGGQEPATVAQQLHDFLAVATTSLDIAAYDLALGPGLEELVVDTRSRKRDAAASPSGSRTTRTTEPPSRCRLRRS